MSQSCLIIRCHEARVLHGSRFKKVVVVSAKRF
jgi:hypothetical protein